MLIRTSWSNFRAARETTTGRGREPLTEGVPRIESVALGATLPTAADLLVPRSSYIGKKRYPSRRSVPVLGPGLRYHPVIATTLPGAAHNPSVTAHHSIRIAGYTRFE